ncbi:uncharacterized protein METZ01_LOCUS69671 [marine metagenome]|uniref:Prohead core protein n=1 Tax=marine metagenome TaxID=408172 RepID=A0A381TPS5_9ZZZZ
MAETDKIEALEAKAVEEANSPNPQADAPKKNAVAAEPSHIAKMSEYEDLGKAVVKPTDSNPDATKKMKKVSGQAPQKSQGAADAMPKLSGHNTKLENKETKDKDGKEIKEGDLPPALQKAIDAKKDKKDVKESDEKKDDKKKDDAEVRTEDEDKEKKKEIDVKEHVDALIAGEKDLTEEFKAKAATIFEAAIKSKVKEITEELETDYNKKFEQESAKAKSELTEKVDSYLAYVVEEWMKENEIALERGIKGEIAEDFINGLKKLFEDHYIDVPDEKYNVLEDQAGKIEKLEKDLNEQISKNVELNKEVGTKVRDEIQSKVSEDLADTAKEKFAKLAEGIEYSNAKDYQKKLETVKESYFGKKNNEAKENLDDVAADGSVNPDLSNSMAAYSAAISKTKDIKLSIK